MTRFISTQTITLELPLKVDHLPEVGTEVSASVLEGAVVAGGFFLAATVARQGVAVGVASTLGTGPNSVQARHSLGRESISVLLPETVGDIGIRIVAIDAEGTRTIVTSPGVETEPNPQDFEKVVLRPEDWVLINLNDLAYPQLAATLSAWAKTLPERVHLAVQGGPLVGGVDLDVLVNTMQRADLLTLNKQQADAIGSRIGRGPIAEILRRYLNPRAHLILRDGANGATIQETADQTPIGISAFQGEIVDTTGVGDAHTGVLIASLMQGKTLEESVLRANAAATLVLQRRGYYKVPSATQIEEFLGAN